MASRKNIWDALDKMEGKKEGSSLKALNKERVRQGYKKEIAKKMGKKQERNNLFETPDEHIKKIMRGER